MREKVVRATYMWLLTHLMECRELADLSEQFKKVCILALSHEAVEMSEDIPHAAEPECLGTEFTAYPIPTGKTTLRTGTPFGQLFSKLEEDVRKELTMSGPVANRFYSPRLLKQLQVIFMPLVPLWTKVLIGDKPLPSNAAVESFFKTMKKNLLRSRTGLLAGDFVRTVLNDLSARVKADIMSKKVEKAKESDKSKGRKRTHEKASCGLSPERARERWGPKQRRRNVSKRPYRERDPPDILKKATKPKIEYQPSPSPVVSIDDNQMKELAAPLNVGNIVVANESWKTLAANSWLDDSIVDASLLASASSTSDDVTVFSVHCMDRIARVPIARGIKETIQGKHGELSNGTWLVPFNTVRNNGVRHWALFVVVHRARRIILWDSLFPAKPSTSAVDDIMALITPCRGPAPWREWKVIYPDQVKQQDGSSCGLFVCAISHAFCTGSPLRSPSNSVDQKLFVGRTVQEMRRRLLTVSSTDMLTLCMGCMHVNQCPRDREIA